MNCAEWIETNYHDGQDKDILCQAWHDRAMQEYAVITVALHYLNAKKPETAKEYLKKRLEQLDNRQHNKNEVKK